MSVAYKRFLVTGGAGFIGKHLCEYLVTHGAQVRVLDNFSTGTPGTLQSLSNIEIITGSITDYQSVYTASRGCDYTIHLAAVVSVPQAQQDPALCTSTNIQGTAHVLEAARQTGVSRVVFASSAAVYGNTHGVCQEDSTPNPESTYGYSKFIGELLCQQYSKTYNLPTLCLRFFNVYGPGQEHAPYPGVLTVLRTKLERNEPITLFGDGQQTRDFVPVSHVVRALVAGALCNQTWCTGQAINVATGSSVTLLEKLEELRAEFPDYTHNIQFAPPRTGDIQHSGADCSKLQKLLQL